MINFKEHDGMLFKMLDKPVPLTPDAEMPCLVRLIQDDSPMGKMNKEQEDYYYGVALKLCLRPVLVKSIDDRSQFDTPWEHRRYEIIGYPVADGSAEWALYQMMQGEKVCNPALAAEKATRLGYDDVERFNIFWYIVGDVVVEGEANYGALSVSSWIAAASSTGWQIYTETKPLLADAKVGNLCKHRNGEWSQIIDMNGTYIPGQPIRTTLKDTKGINRNFCLSGSHFITQFGGEYDIIHTEPLAPEGSAEWAWQMAKLGIETRCHEGKIMVAKSGLIEVCPNGMAYAMPLTQSAENRQYVINKIRECSPDGWQIYKEPKEEPKLPKEQKIDSGEKEYTCLVCGKKMSGLDGRAEVSIKRISISSLYESTFSHYCGKCFLELGFDKTEKELRNRQQPQVESEPQTAKEPIADCENCKHVCTNSNIDHCHMYEPKPAQSDVEK